LRSVRQSYGRSPCNGKERHSGLSKLRNDGTQVLNHLVQPKRAYIAIRKPHAPRVVSNQTRKSGDVLIELANGGNVSDELQVARGQHWQEDERWAHACLIVGDANAIGGFCVLDTWLHAVIMGDHATLELLTNSVGRSRSKSADKQCAMRHAPCNMCGVLVLIVNGLEGINAQ
jgi:hypothetical protein